MQAIFADTCCFLVLLDRRDAHHRRVVDFATGFNGALVTTRWVLAEVANALSASPARAAVARLLQRVEEDDSLRVIRSSDEFYGRGLALFSKRPDKDWSLTDCISFVAMADEGLAGALTGDRQRFSRRRGLRGRIPSCAAGSVPVRSCRRERDGSTWLRGPRPRPRRFRGEF
ncbi:MAG: PIN domain-containing protein [Verrucomicrobia bacterium]|nr:PIN domain-containing protein [Verrucomicrobiota bacterium]